MSAHGPEWADVGGREPVAVSPRARCHGKLIPPFGIKLMLIKSTDVDYNTWVCECARKLVGIENGIMFLRGRLAVLNSRLKKCSHLVLSNSTSKSLSSGNN